MLCISAKCLHTYCVFQQNVDESIQLGPGGGAAKFSGWGRGSTGGTSGRASMEKEKPNTPANRYWQIFWLYG